MAEELVVIEQVSELVVVAPVAAEFLVREPAALDLVETIERGPAGATGDTGEKGDKGDAGPAAVESIVKWIEL